MLLLLVASLLAAATAWAVRQIKHLPPLPAPHALAAVAAFLREGERREDLQFGGGEGGEGDKERD